MDLVETKRPTPDERRTAILDIAYEAFLRDGYAGTSMSRIAALLGGSKTTLYNYFASKHELLVAVIDRECAKVLAPVFVVSDAAGDFRARIEDMARRLLTAFLDEKLLESQRLIVAESGRFPEVGQTAYEFGVASGLRQISAHFRRAMEAGEMRRSDPDIAAEQFLDLTDGSLHRRRLWNVIGDVSAEAIAVEAGRIANTFVAAFGNDTLSKAARAL